MLYKIHVAFATLICYHSIIKKATKILKVWGKNEKIIYCHINNIICFRILFNTCFCNCWKAAKKRKARDENLRNLDRFENKDKEFHDKVRLGYLEMAKKEPERFVVIDATKSPEEINKKIVKEFLKRYVQLGKKNESTEKSVDL